MYRFLIKKTYMNLLLSMEYDSKTTRQLCKRVGITYNTVLRVMKQWSKEGIIQRVREENGYDNDLTPKGKAIVEKLKQLKSIIEGDEYATE